LDPEGNLYGTAGYEGNVSSAWCSANLNCGVVFKVDRSGNESVLHAFAGPPDGYEPFDSVIRDQEGNLYGTTFGGGDAAQDVGTVFKLDRAGDETVLHNFANTPDGEGPAGGVIRDSEGNLYGTTWGGGDAPLEWGTVFKLGPAGKETVLYNFTGGADGGGPWASLIRDGEGNLYGTTVTGGAGGAPGYPCTIDGVGCGVVFKLDRTGKETVLHSFTGGADGAGPFGLFQDSDGTLYGVASEGGSFGAGTPGGAGGNGVVFKVDPKGKFSVLYTFTGGADGAVPFGTPLKIGNDLYGTAYGGGNETSAICTSYGCGVVYRLDANGNETVLYTFTGYADGDDPSQGLVSDGKANLYGTAQYGGDLASPASACAGYGCGVVFKLTLHY
jgi:uncharacterized repeat protein (TIGR03803 family)